MNNHILKNLICGVLVSIMIVFSIPFHSSASAVGIEAGIPTVDWIATLYSFFLGHEMVANNISRPYSQYLDYEDIDSNYLIFQDMNSYKTYPEYGNAGLGDIVKGYLLTGALTHSYELDSWLERDLRHYFADRTQNNQTIPLTSNIVNFGLNSADYTTTIEVKYHTLSNPSVQTTNIIISSPTPYFIGSIANTDSDYQNRLMIFNTVGSSPTVSVQSTNPNFNPVRSSDTNSGFTTSDNHSFTGRCNTINIYTKYNGNPYYVFDSINVFAQHFPGLSYTFSITDLSDIFYNMIHSGTATLRMTDTLSRVGEGVTVVNKSSTVDPDTGEIVGPYTMAVPDLSTLETILNMLNSNVITLKNAVQSIGLNTVDDTASVAEKQAVISTIPDVQVQAQSDVISDVSSETLEEARTKTSAVVHIAHTIANAIATVTGQDEPYPDEDIDYHHTPLPERIGWTFPDLNGEDPDPGGSGTTSDEDRNRASDVLSGVAAVSTIGTSIYNSASGYNLIVTVGYSLVIFSAIIGAGHFFGALSGRHQDTKQTSLNWKKSDTWDSNNTNWNSKW